MIKDVSEANQLLSRLSLLVHGQLALNKEKELALTETQTEFEKKHALLVEELQHQKDVMNEEFDSWKQQITTQHEIALQQQNELYQKEKKETENQILSLKEQLEEKDAVLKKELREKDIFQKQTTESLRLYEIADERLMELRMKTKELEEQLRDFHSTKEKNVALEKEVTVLQVKFDGLVKEEQLKRDYLEKDLRREF